MNESILPIDMDIRQNSDLKNIMMIYAKIHKNYTAAIREVKTKLQNLDDDFQLLHKHNPIHHMESRIKSPESILEKANRKGFSSDVNQMCKQMLDIAGIRVICCYINDIYIVADLLKKQSDLSIIREVDYIKNPKDNGYRSLHLIVEIPVFFVHRVEKIPVEIQIRTMAMDFWASLEHQLRYKAEGEIPKFIAEELKECSENIAHSDLQMQKVHSFLEDLDRFTPK
ncbi:GTP pyrophosphokinase family protein [Aminipila butyrica]|uniref:GTP pyrophosphokinase family protein n=1 Tax=Aminipila butyrica TaxID=433296 RepID=A0A858BRV1_9FIRM|nr:GTP pyrophosphokinase family protein [Aminipila butyrica]QIB67845.1 GTP pyrophosphokinase family protein [Aminipila butyrica]